jgi:hypothetical protein
MRIRTGAAVLILGRQRKDGWRCVYAVRLTDWSGVQRSLRKAKIKARLVGDRLFVRPANPHQRLFAFLELTKAEDISPCALIPTMECAEPVEALSISPISMTPP